MARRFPIAPMVTMLPALPCGAAPESDRGGTLTATASGIIEGKRESESWTGRRIGER